RDAREPHVRGLLAGALAEHVAILAPLATTTRLSHFALPSDRVFPQPHSRLFQPCDADADVGWVRELARRARSVAAAAPPAPSLGDCDCPAEHVRFAASDHDRLTAPYDWDSLAACPETRLIGTAAHAHTADWSTGASLPTHDEILAFIDQYSASRAAPLSAAER